VSLLKEWRGDRAFENRLRNAEARIRREVPIAMSEVIAKTHDLSVSYAPRISGLLQETSEGRVGGRTVSHGGNGQAGQVATVQRMEGNTLKAVIAFRTPYALKVHEKNVTGREKYLEVATVERMEANKKRLSLKELKVFK